MFHELDYLATDRPDVDFHIEQKLTPGQYVAFDCGEGELWLGKLTEVDDDKYTVHIYTPSRMDVAAKWQPNFNTPKGEVKRYKKDPPAGSTPFTDTFNMPPAKLVATGTWQDGNIDASMQQQITAAGYMGGTKIEDTTYDDQGHVAAPVTLMLTTEELRCLYPSDSGSDDEPTDYDGGPQYNPVLAVQPLQEMKPLKQVHFDPDVTVMCALLAPSTTSWSPQLSYGARDILTLPRQPIVMPLLRSPASMQSSTLPTTPARRALQCEEAADDHTLTYDLATLAQTAYDSSPQSLPQPDSLYIISCLRNNGILTTGTARQQKYRMVCFLAQQPQYTVALDIIPADWNEQRKIIHSLRKMIFAQGGNGFGSTMDIIRRAMGDAEPLPNPCGLPNILQTAQQIRAQYLMDRTISSLYTVADQVYRTSATEVISPDGHDAGSAATHYLTRSPLSDSNTEATGTTASESPRPSQWQTTNTFKTMCAATLTMLIVSMVAATADETQMVTIANLTTALTTLFQIVFRG